MKNFRTLLIAQLVSAFLLTIILSFLFLLHSKSLIALQEASDELLLSKSSAPMLPLMVNR
ncbi:hypothetical protein [Alishewanella longhuensis]